MTDQLAEPFSHIFIDRAEVEWAFDLLREAVRRLRVTDPYDPRAALTVSRRGERGYALRLNFGGWLVLGFRGPGAARVDLTLLASRVAWDERFESVAFERKEGEHEVRSYALPLAKVRPLTSDLQSAFFDTLDVIAAKFNHWKKATHWKQHRPEIIEALFDPDRRANLLAAGLAAPELIYERTYTAFGQELAEEVEAYGVDTQNSSVEKIMVESGEVVTSDSSLAEPFSKIFIDRAEAEWAFDFLREALFRIGIDVPSDIHFSLTLPHNGRVLRLNFGNWAVLSFYAPGFGANRVGLVLLADRMDFHAKYEDYSFRQDSDEPDVRLYKLPVEMLTDVTSSVKETFFETLDYTRRRFQNWSQSPYLKFHLPQIAEAVFDLDKRNALLENGLAVANISLADESIEAVEFAPPNPPNPPHSPNPPLTLAEIAAETGFAEAELARWVRAIERKGQAVLYGPPGTGKTFVAQKLANHLIGGGDGFAELVQFHPAYAYEDFVQGIRPDSSGGQLRYPLVKGRFLQFCERAARRRDPCVLIIDEINRANLARVFGELMFLLEYRDRSVPLAGGGELQIPANVRLIGTMNTADRSIALVDHALRRRFAFIALRPNFEALRRFHHATGFPVEPLIATLTELNRTIDNPDYAVGISFFLRPDLADHLADIWQMEIEPYLDEYFFNQPGEVDAFRWGTLRTRFEP